MVAVVTTSELHEAVPGIQTCTGEGCTGSENGKEHQAHPKFSCTCGRWYVTARGLRSHVMREAAFLTVADAQAMAVAAGMTLTKYCEPANEGT